jgi:hypothetical protein
MKFFLVVTMCMQVCYSGYIQEPFDNQQSCQAYGTVYAEVLQQKFPQSSGELNCVPANMMDDLKQELPLGILKPLEELSAPTE